MSNARGGSALFSYGLAFVSVGAALVLTIVLLRFDSPLPFTAFALLAVAVTFWCGGAGPGILAVALSTLARSYFFGPATPAVSRMLYESAFLVFALLMIWLTRARSELEVKVAERTAELTQANEELQLEIAERKQAEARVRLALDTAPTLILSGRPDGYLDFLINVGWTTSVVRWRT
jgi:K+-sensing histidine kinase KdpD